MTSIKNTSDLHRAYKTITTIETKVQMVYTNRASNVLLQNDDALATITMSIFNLIIHNR